ncbi:unnamed protein product [Miscanthus lutarioriparius]|uniref:Uncharacterized protein n=1 Tax=Miscanthus lutarioriparius TaxID=422564 RepID=A0A811MXW0_9POAL|nr:unnamed protein product [Miscanthus lutarioriparius]
MAIKLLKYRLTGANVFYEFPTDNLANTPWPASPLKSEFSSSPYTPLSSQLECDNLSALSNTPDNQSSTETISAQPISPLEVDSSYRQAAILRENTQVRPDPLYITSRHNMQHALREIETVLMAPDAEDAATSTKHEFEEHKPAQLMRQRSRTWSHESRQPSPGVVRPQFASGYPTASYEFRPEKRLRELREDPQSMVKQLLTKCAEASSEERIDEFLNLVQQARGVVSITGEPIQRLGAYLLEGLVARHANSGTNIYRALKCREPESNELLSYMKILYNICPYFKFGYMAANGAIAEALRNEDKIHIIDFQIAQGTQWITLIQALRCKAWDDPVSEYARGEGLDLVGKMLKSMSEEFKIPLEFTPLPGIYATQVTKELLDIKPGEALAVNFTLQLHHTPDESVDVNNPRTGYLDGERSVSKAMFESIDTNLPRENKERINVEQHCLAKDIVNIIACEGKDRVERHELLGKWRSRLTMAGFRPYPLSSYVNSVIRKLLACYSDKYTLEEKDGAMLLGWKNRKLISASAWH